MGLSLLVVLVRREERGRGGIYVPLKTLVPGGLRQMSVLGPALSVKLLMVEVFFLPLAAAVIRLVNGIS